MFVYFIPKYRPQRLLSFIFINKNFKHITAVLRLRLLAISLVVSNFVSIVEGNNCYCENGIYAYTQHEFVLVLI